MIYNVLAQNNNNDNINLIRPPRKTVNMRKILHHKCAITQTHTSTQAYPYSWEVGESKIRFRERSLIEGNESMVGQRLRETCE